MKEDGIEREVTLRARVLETIRKRKENVESGNINCIPSPFVRFRKAFPGLEQARYYLISAGTKVGKTQLTSYLMYSALDFAYCNTDKLHLKIFYFPLEESEQEIVLRYMSYLLYELTDRRMRVSPTDLMSTDADRIIPEEALSVLESEEFQSRMKFFEEHVEFSEERNCTGIYHVLFNYAKGHGKSIYRSLGYENKEGNEYKKFNHYVPDDPKEYVIPIVDHVSLLSPERGFDLRESINKLSEYFVILRNRYGYSPVAVQQQSTETTSLEAFKSRKIRPTMAGLGDSKYTAHDCDMMLGLCSPYAYELPNYLGYDVSKFRDNIRFMEVVVNRHGTSNDILALYFDGATCSFNELPLPNQVSDIAKVLEFIDKRNKVYDTKRGIVLFTHLKWCGKILLNDLHRFFN